VQHAAPAPRTPHTSAHNCQHKSDRVRLGQHRERT
jgi:hypothetical protein